jgi:hypothetical protein
MGGTMEPADHILIAQRTLALAMRLSGAERAGAIDATASRPSGDAAARYNRSPPDHRTPGRIRNLQQTGNRRFGVPRLSCRDASDNPADDRRGEPIAAMSRYPRRNAQSRSEPVFDEAYDWPPS